MTSLGRTYVVAGTLVVFFVLWAAIAASPWRTAQADPRAEALAQREALVRREAIVAQQLHRQRWDAYRAALVGRRAVQASVDAAPAPTVRMVQLPPVATTRTS